MPIRGQNGGTSQNIVGKVRHMGFLKRELVDLREVKNKSEQLKTEKENLEKENVRLHERCDQLEVEAIDRKGRGRTKNDICCSRKAEKGNAHLRRYLDKIEEQKQFENTGKNL